MFVLSPSVSFGRTTSSPSFVLACTAEQVPLSLLLRNTCML